MIHRKTARPLVKLLAIYMTALLMVAALASTSGCGPSARTKTLSATLVTVNAARDGFLAFDKARHDQIVDGCNAPTCTFEQGEARLVAYWVKREPVVRAFDVAYAAIAVAALDESSSLPAVILSVDELTRAIAALRADP